MSQTSQIGVLPTSTFLDFKPTVLPSPDFKTLFQIDKAQKDAIARRDEMALKSEMAMYRGLNNTFNEGNTYLNGDNPWQKSVTEGIQQELQPYYQGMSEALEKGDPRAFSKNQFEYRKALISSAGVKEAEAQKKRHQINVALLGRMKDADPDKINDYLEAYSNWDGTGADPTLTFNAASFNYYNPFEEDDIVKMFVGSDAIQLDPYTKGKPVLSPEEANEKLDYLYNIKGKNSGLSKEEWKNQIKSSIYSGAVKVPGRGYFRLTDQNIPKVDANGNNTSSSRNTSSKEPDEVWGYDDVTKLPTYTDKNTKTTMNSRYTGTWNAVTGNIETDPISDIEFLENQNKEYKAQIDQSFKELSRLVSEGYVTTDYNGNITSTDKDPNGAVRERYQAIQKQVRDMGYAIKENNGIIKDSQPAIEEYQKSKGYEEYQKNITGIFLNEVGSKFTVNNGTYLSEKDIRSKVNEMIKSKDEEKVEIGKRILKRLEKEKEANLILYNKSNRKESNNPTYNTEEYILDQNDLDYQAIQANINGGMSEGMQVVNRLNGSKTEVGEGEKLNIKSIRWSPRARKYVYTASLGTAVKKGKGDASYVITPEGKYELKPETVKDVDIITDNLTDIMMNTQWGGYGKNADMAKSIHNNLANTVDISDKKTAKGSIMYRPDTGDYQKVDYRINKKGGEYYLSFPNDSELDAQVKNIPLGRTSVVKVLMDMQVGNPRNTQYPQYEPVDPSIWGGSSNGGATTSMGKSQMRGEYNTNTYSFLAEEETKGYSLDNSYLAINNRIIPSNKNMATNALGRFQFVPTSYGDKILKYTKDLPKPTQEQLENFKKNTLELSNRINNPLYDSAHIEAYYKFLHSPETQEKLMDDVYNTEYKPRITEVKNAYKRIKGMNITDAQAVDVMHYNGIGAAQQAKGHLPRVGADARIGGIKVDNSWFKIKSGKSDSYKEVDAGLKEDVNYIGTKLFNGVDFNFTSGKRDYNPSSQHFDGDAMDFTFPPKDEEKVLRAIANTTNDPEANYQRLLNSKNKKNPRYNDFIKINIGATGRSVWITYHNAGSGPHIHVQNKMT